MTKVAIKNDNITSFGGEFYAHTTTICCVVWHLCDSLHHKAILTYKIFSQEKVLRN